MQITVGSCIVREGDSRKYWIEEISGERVMLGYYEGGWFPESPVSFRTFAVRLSTLRVKEILFAPLT
jgi:hypothetical protein